MSFSALLIEVAYTRIFSFKLYYYYVFLIIGLALLGTGAGGVFVAVSKRLRRASTDSIIFWCFLLGAASTIAGYAIVAYIHINTLAVWLYTSSQSGVAFLQLLAMCLCVFVSFIPPGIMISTLFGRRPRGAGGVYFADLVGAGVACALVIYLIDDLGAPATVMVAALAMAAGAVWVGLRRRPWAVAMAVPVLASAAVFVVGPGLLPPQQIDTSKTLSASSKVAYSGWGPVFRVDASEPIPLGKPGPGGLVPETMLLEHDAIIGAGIYHWNGKRSSIAAYHFGTQTLSLPFDVMGGAPDREAVIGAAGGHEVLASLGYGAKHIDAVELNPVTTNLVEHVYANFDGHLAQYPGVDYITGDGWSFMARHKGRFNLVWYPAPDSYAANNAGLASANVSVESYLYTTNALESMFQHTTNSGFFVAQFGEVNDVYDLRTARLVATARQALAEMGISDPRDHIMVSMSKTNFLGSQPVSTIFVKREPFTPAQEQGFLAGVKKVPDTSILYAPGQKVAPNPVQSVVTVPNDRLNAFYASFPYNITPTTENDPYFYHFSRFGTVLDNYTHSLSSVDRENQVAERVLLLVLAVSIVAGAIFLLLPFATIRKKWVRLPRKGWSAVYFAGLGLGFMFFEITLMQDLNLFLGYPSYALTVTLMALLVFSGLGALLSERVRHRARAIPALLVALAALTLFYLVGLIPLTDALLNAPMAARVLVTLAVLAPLGLCLGMFMPIGVSEIAQLGDSPREYVAWGWAVNGFAAVVGTALATILAMSFGFAFVLGLALASYTVAVAAWLLLVRPRRAGRSSRGRHSPGTSVVRVETPVGAGRG
jgi:hypothetical protein